jgi:hypothetical protein
MQVISLLWGILALLGMLVGFVPFLGALNWLNIPFAGFGAIVSAIALGTTSAPSKGKSIAGLVCCGIALFFGIIRLALGGGIL